MAYPFSKDLQTPSQNMKQGNFGLWYNKFIPIKDFVCCKASDDHGNDNNAVLYCEKKYRDFKKDKTGMLLDKKHLDQVNFYRSFSPQYELITITAKLNAPLITGIGESHPHEVSMVFERNLGIPYIPASSIKGIVRFAHTLMMINNISFDQFKPDKDGELYFDEEQDDTIRNLFGVQDNRGRVIFLDAYPKSVPDLYVDIMNPHYGDYYSDDKHKTPPADYLNPNPIKFLTVAKGTVFIFRALVDKEHSKIKDKVNTAFKKALTEEGVGAKTAIGYGLFELIKMEEGVSFHKIIQHEKVKNTLIQETKPIDRFIAAIKAVNPTDAGRIGSLIDNALTQIGSDNERKIFVQAVKEHMGKTFKKSKAKKKLEPFLD